jgi:hypothetical protein
MAFPLRTAEGADIDASESLPDPALLAPIDPTGRRRLTPSG